MQRANKIYLRFENERIDSNVCTINIRIPYVHAARKLLFFIDKQAWRSQRYEPGAKIVMRRERERAKGGKKLMGRWLKRVIWQRPREASFFTARIVVLRASTSDPYK